MIHNVDGQKRHFSGTLLRKARTDIGLTLCEASDKAGIKWQQWQKYELGKAKPTADTVALLADIVECSIIDELYDYKA